VTSAKAVSALPRIAASGAKLPELPTGIGHSDLFEAVRNLLHGGSLPRIVT
jgi:hypothetical protein